MDQLVPFPPSSVPSAAGTGGHPQRVGDAERNAVCTTLSAHYAAGRLSAEELDLRLGSAVQAVTVEHLRLLLADLPVGVPAPAAAPVRRESGLLDPLAFAALVVTVLVAGVAFLAVLAAGDVAYFIVCALSASTAAVGAASATHLLHRRAQVVQAGAEARAQAAQRPRMA